MAVVDWDVIHLEVKGRPFAAAVEYLKEKVDLPTEHWHDLMGAMHSRAFVVAGATSSSLLADFHSAVNKAISSGTTLEQFRKDFDDIVNRYGWSYNGNRNWRSKLIYNTNIQVAYQAGRYQRLSEIEDIAPYWEYRTKRDARVRAEHKRWEGLILRADDQWWDSHYPPNGWGCRCRVWPRTDRDLQLAGKERPDSAPDDGTYEWAHPGSGEVFRKPVGIDPGWDYHPGKAAWGRRLSEDAMAAWRTSSDKWQSLTVGDWRDYNRPEKIEVDTPRASLGKGASNQKELTGAIAASIGGLEKTFRLQADDFSFPVLVNAQTLAAHIDLNRSAYVPFLPELLDDPFEVWMSFEQHSESGKVVLRQRIIKAVRLDKDRGLLMVANSVNGIMEAWTLIPSRDLGYLGKQRSGKLVWTRK